MANTVLYPGDTIGVIGSSENAAMLVTKARKMGLRVGAYGSDETSEALQLADFKAVGSAKDKDKLQHFAESCAVVVYDSDHVSTDVVKFLSQYTRIPQGSDLLEMMQDRLLERAFFEQLNVNIAPYATIISLDDVYQSINSIGYPCVLKPIQKEWSRGRELVIKTQTDIAKAAGLLDWGTYILESQIAYDKEYSLLVARDADGNQQLFPIIEAQSVDDRPFKTWVPANVDAAVASELQRIAGEVGKHVNYVGVFEVSCYLTQSGAIYVKKITPAPSENGYVFAAAATVDEFDEHLRAICGLPLAEPKILTPAVTVAFMVSQQPAMRTQWQIKPNWHFTFYHLRNQRPDDIMGHVALQGDSVKTMLDQLDDTGIWSANDDDDAGPVDE
ncbi:ATP-grasp domain-containing protein [Levilactobacillus suantsaii]|uniref:ATP-grasp domain-containing protein n=1 Tax=Levilactobacillus suantsaii TaxID=2292255 RepID=A0A4Q0VLI9_9LACO|nr:ATP-grasp domain-containing protein [Levilactobacillus suantsaii]QMU07245.1 ATP-grasp domain-containing protein [Levilactobacillus suantsaii]RXI80000.1 ATP-grasp domain-containing protein [Levilactobacillus suantsaii]